MTRYIIAGAERKHCELPSVMSLAQVSSAPVSATYQGKVKLGRSACLPSFRQHGDGYASRDEDKDYLEDVCDGLAFLHVARIDLHCGPLTAPMGSL